MSNLHNKYLSQCIFYADSNSNSFECSKVLTKFENFITFVVSTEILHSKKDI